MPNSLRCKIKHLCHNGTLTERERDRILKALEQESCDKCSDRLTVSFDNSFDDESGLCATRKHGEKIVVLKMELGEQADILYRLLTDQMAKAEIRAESEVEK